MSVCRGCDARLDRPGQDHAAKFPARFPAPASPGAEQRDKHWVSRFNFKNFRYYGANAPTVGKCREQPGFAGK